VELTLYNGIPHLLTPAITEPKRAVESLRWALEEMEDRYKQLEQAKVRDIEHYNKGKKISDIMPYIIIVIDELADLMATHGREVEGAIVRLSQMARAVGIHLVVATQRPSVSVITGLIKANITTRLAFQVASQVDSRTILDMSGAEKLLGKGDMLFLDGRSNKPRRVQGSLITQKEVKAIVKNIIENMPDKKQEYVSELVKTSADTQDQDKSMRKTFLPNNGQGEKGNSRVDKEVLEELPDDELYDDAKKVVIDSNRASASLLQRRLSVGYARAARLLDLLEAHGVIGPHRGSKAREVLIDAVEE